MRGVALRSALTRSRAWLPLQGVLRMGQEIEVRPGIVAKDSTGRIKCTPIYSRVVTLLAEQTLLQARLGVLLPE